VRRNTANSQHDKTLARMIPTPQLPSTCTTSSQSPITVEPRRIALI